jgi:PhoP regulatory network protein YrbL
MSKFLTFKDTAPLAKGHSRLVFQHPDDVRLLVKVIRPDMIDKRWGSGAAWYKRKRRYGRFISYIRETQEYIASCVPTGRGPDFLQKVVGFVETDLGLGIVIEAVRTPSGELASNIAALIERGQFNATVRTALDTVKRQILENDLTLSDLNVGNLVYTGDEKTPGRFILIDGLGTATIFPLKRFSKYLNRRSKLGKFKRIQVRIDQRLATALEAGIQQRD